jgi:hypothetical protein
MKTSTTRTHPAITPEHLRRLAVIYVRQSTEFQVRNNTGSTASQRSLVAVPRAYGWADAEIQIIEDDLGKSGSTSEGRAGWQRLQRMIEARQVGAVFAADASRFSRQLRDFEIFRLKAALHGTLLYTDGHFLNPAEGSDIAVSQLSAMVAQFDGRKRTEFLTQAAMSKARSGQAASKFPTGWIKRPDDKYEYDPQAKDAIQTVIKTFWQTRSIRQTVIALAKADIQIPCRKKNGELCFTNPTDTRVRFILTHPAYAGTYVFARTQLQRGGAVSEGGHSKRGKLPEERWIKIPNHHPTYMTVEEQEQIKSVLAHNRTKRRRPRRWGPTPLQGLSRCAVCGAGLTITYLDRGYTYTCRGSQHYLAKPCMRFSSLELDRFVVQEVMKVLEAPPLEMLKAAREAARTKKQARRDWTQSERERLAHEERVAEERAELARGKLQRVYFAALEQIEQIREEKERFEKKVALQPAPSNQESEEEIEELCRIARDVPELWNHPAMTHQERKEILRCLIDHITVGATKEKIDGTIFWKAGAQTPFLIWRGAGVLNLIRELHAQKLTTREIQQHLAAGKTSTGQVVQMSVDMIRRRLCKMKIVAGKYSTHQLQVLQKITELDCEGRSFTSIARYLNDNGFPSASGKSWNRGMVVHLLYGTGRKRESLEKIHYRVMAEARVRGLGYGEIAAEFNERQIRRRGGPYWTAKYAQRRCYYLNRMLHKREQKEVTDIERSELIVPQK